MIVLRAKMSRRKTCRKWKMMPRMPKILSKEEKRDTLVMNHLVLANRRKMSQEVSTLLKLNQRINQAKKKPKDLMMKTRMLLKKLPLPFKNQPLFMKFIRY